MIVHAERCEDIESHYPCRAMGIAAFITLVSRPNTEINCRGAGIEREEGLPEYCRFPVHGQLSQGPAVR